MRSGILLKMKLASLPRNRRKYAHSGSFQTNMIVADDQFQSMKAPGNQRLQELTPMHLRFRVFHTHTQLAVHSFFKAGRIKKRHFEFAE